jgi:predicted enzyme related to lactoylglutathione lyase
MLMNGYPEGSVCWVDLGTPDIETSAAFYAELFGWTITETNTPGYRVCAVRRLLVAGLGPAEDPGTPYWTTNISVDDIQATATSFEKSGADIVVPPAAVGQLGHAAVTRDPVGTPVSLWQPGRHCGMALTQEPGTFAGIRLLTDQPERAASFYQDALGWSSDPGLTEFRLPDGSSAPISSGSQPLWLVAFGSNQPEIDAARALDLGATREGHLVLRDPTGALFSLTKTGA